MAKSKKSKNNLSFEDKVLEGLRHCSVSPEVSGLVLGAAVSGGADSVALLLSLCNLAKSFGFAVKVISVNHFIRPDEETCGDFEFVRKLCLGQKNLGFDVEFFPFELERGAVTRLAQKNGIGIEGAARELRYNAFNSFIKNENLDFLCLAHNQNDNLETILMRFLQGSSIESSCGIPFVNGKIIRPLLDITRDEIELYLNEKKVLWRNDSSNEDTAYLRNRIRHKLIPLLDDSFPGWKKSVLSGAKKAFLDSKLLLKNVEAAYSIIEFPDQDGILNDKNAKDCVYISWEKFIKLEPSLKTRVLTRAMNLLDFNNRIPYQFLSEVSDSSSENFKKRYQNIEIYRKKNILFIKKEHKISTDLNIFAIIEKKGMYEFPFGQIEVCGCKKEPFVQLVLDGRLIPKKLEFPFCIRSYRLDDLIKTADGSYRKIKDILADWHVPENKKPLIPVVQSLCSKPQENVCILGSMLGFKDWI